MVNKKLIIILMLLSSILIISCGEEKKAPNIYDQRVIIDQQTFFEYIKSEVPSAEPDLIFEDGKTVLTLGDSVDNKEFNDYKEIKILSKYFEYNPNDDEYIISFRLEGVYQGTFAMKRLEYHPKLHLLKKARYQSKVNLNETWECLTYEDIEHYVKGGSMESDCYSFS